jgi:hypothetical protein
MLFIAAPLLRYIGGYLAAINIIAQFFQESMNFYREITIRMQKKTGSICAIQPKVE